MVVGEDDNKVEMSCQHLQFCNTKSDSTCTLYILNFQESFTTQYGVERKTKSRLECRHRNLGQKLKKETDRKWLISLSYVGDPKGNRTPVAGVRGRSPDR